MARLRHKVTGIVVRVPDARATGLGPEWVPMDQPTEAAPAPKKAAPRRRTVKKK